MYTVLLITRPQFKKKTFLPNFQRLVERFKELCVKKNKNHDFTRVKRQEMS